ncbi:MAG TPA: DUF2203 domain-containing protein [Candidatus Acidoferrales bacterium]|nr:DUF2203 domain-containing protein [Candidatus Acidoferrales bacterium]
MSRFYAIDEANATLPEVERILGALREQREELITARDRALSLTPEDGAATPEDAEQLRLIRLRMQGLIDQMQAGVARLVELDITLRDIKTGLIDFPALATGRPIWLCWRLGENDIQHWHGVDEGFDHRRPIEELPAATANHLPS